MARRSIDWWAEERAARERGFRIIAGIDEAGRGPLAGPVVAVCVVLPFGEELKGVRDSKTLTPDQRDAAFDLICEKAEAIGIGAVDPSAIDAMNILRATHQAMRSALESLPIRPDVALIDGLPVHPFPILQIALVKGDGRSASIAAASIVAKVTRDRKMAEYDALYPQYGFAAHKGYPTPEHLARLQEHGPCPIHRRSFAPVAVLLERDECGRSSQPALPLAAAGRREVGEWGEVVAAAHLRRLGWQVLGTGFHCYDGELDLIAQDGETVVFVEVKARRGPYRSADGTPGENVHRRKRGRMRAAAERWLTEQGGAERACRFDVIEVLFGPDGLAKVNLLRDAFMADE